MSASPASADGNSHGVSAGEVVLFEDSGFRGRLVVKMLAGLVFMAFWLGLTLANGSSLASYLMAGTGVVLFFGLLWWYSSAVWRIAVDGPVLKLSTARSVTTAEPGSQVTIELAVGVPPTLQTPRRNYRLSRGVRSVDELDELTAVFGRADIVVIEGPVGR